MHSVQHQCRHLAMAFLRSTGGTPWLWQLLDSCPINFGWIQLNSLCVTSWTSRYLPDGPSLFLKSMTYSSVQEGDFQNPQLLTTPWSVFPVLKDEWLIINLDKLHGGSWPGASEALEKRNCTGITRFLPMEISEDLTMPGFVLSWISLSIRTSLLYPSVHPRWLK